jgi:hypothetical protein
MAISRLNSVNTYGKVLFFSEDDGLEAFTKILCLHNTETNLRFMATRKGKHFNKVG